MTRFIYLADTHIGAGAGGYIQQPRYVDHLPSLMEKLRIWIEVDGGINFILHGGDMVDHVSVANLHLACELFALPVPVYVCLGNHDMDHPGAAELWLAEAPHFFPGMDVNYAVPCEGALLHMLPTQWCEKAYFWDGVNQHPHFLASQVEMLTTHLTANGNPHILCTHGEIAGVPHAQTGFDTSYHPPLPAYRECVCAIARQNKNLKCILSAHNHINTNVKACGTDTVAVTVSAFTEAPFEFKVIDVQPGALSMRTENLIEACDFKVDYNYNKTFVQGRLKDRTLTLNYPAA